MLDPNRLLSGSGSRRCLSVGALSASLFLAGCGGIIGFSIDGSSPGNPKPGYDYLTGNWQIDVTEGPGKPTFSAMAGFIAETSASPNNTLTAVFQLSPAACFAGAATLPLTGTVIGSAVTLDSFSDTGQFVHFKGTKDTTATHLTGTYVIGGGCSTGGTGSILTGTKYAPLSGTYAGTVGSSSPAPGISLNLTQAALANGSGYSPVSGTGTFTGFPCFSTGTLTADGSSVIGRSVQLTLTANDGETVTLIGTFDSAATALAITSTAVSGGACSGSLGSATLSHS